MHIELSGRTDPDARTLVLSAGLGGLGSFWLPQMNALRETCRVVIYDQRGTGRSAGSLPDGYSMQDMADELIALLDSHQIQQFDIIGHALGGMIAMQLALDHPQRVRRLVLVNAWLQLDAHTRRCFSVRQDLLLQVGVEAFVRAQPLFLYPADWLSVHQERMEAEDALHVAHFQGRDNLLKRLHALMQCDYSSQAAQIVQPVLLLCARDDLLVPWTCSVRLSQQLPHATLSQMHWGGHAMSVTDSTTFNCLLLEWLQNTDTAAYAIDRKPV